MSAYFDVELFLSTFFTLFVIMDPPGNLPIFLGLTSTQTSQERKRSARVATLTSLGLLTTFGLFGTYILGFLHITPEAMQFSGGLLLLLVALQLLTGEEENPGNPSSKSNVAMVPLGTPLLAGPGTIVAIMLSAEQASGHTARIIAVIVALLSVHLVQWLSMRFGVALHRFLGDSGITLLTKLSGMLLAAIATQLMVNAVLTIVEQM